MNQSELRLNTLAILERHDLTKLWAPFMVDIALNRTGGASTIKDVLTPDFVNECRERAEGYVFFSDFDWTAESLLVSIHRGKPLLAFFVERAYGSVLRTLRVGQISAGDAEELRALVMASFQEVAHAYRPGKSNGDEYTSWGYEAYLTNYGVRKATTKAKDLLFRQHEISLDSPVGDRTVGDYLEELAPNSFVPPPPANPKLAPDAVHDLVGAATEEVLSEDDIALYLLYVSGRVTLANITKELKIPLVTAHWRMTKIAKMICEKTSELFAIEHNLDMEEAAGEVLGYAWGVDKRPLPTAPTPLKGDLRVALDDLMSHYDEEL